MDFAYGLGGHMGPRYGRKSLTALAMGTKVWHRKFWRNVLPKLKYYNPAVDMTVNSSGPIEGPATLTWFYHPAQSSEQVTTKTIDMKHKHTDDILAEFVTGTQAQSVEETEADRTIAANLKRDVDEIEANKAKSQRLIAERKRRSGLLNVSRRDSQTKAEVPDQFKKKRK